MQQNPELQSTNLDLASHIARFRIAEWNDSKSYLSLIVLLVAAIFFVHDIYIDVVVENKGLSHVVIEGSIFLAISLALFFEVIRVVMLSTSVSLNQKQIRRLKQHLNDAIGEEFDRWELTGTEKEIALLLIKGLSMREIATLRQVKEKSVRQQSTGIYAKAGVANRNELTSYFIEDLLAP